MNKHLTFMLLCASVLLATSVVQSHAHKEVHEHGHGHGRGHQHDHHDHDHHNHDHDHHNHDHGHHNHDHDHHNHDHDHHNHDHGHHNHDHDHHNHDHGHHDHHNHHDHSRDSSDVWKEALMGTFIVTAGGNAAILVFLKHDISPNFLRVMVSFAVGGLLGDVFLHLLPHAMESAGGHDHHDHSHGHDHDHDDDHAHDHSHDLTVGLSLLAGILCFFMVEKALRALDGGHSHSHSHGKHEDHQQDERPVDSEPATSGTVRRRKNAPKSPQAKDQPAPANKDRSPEKPPQGMLGNIKPGAILNMTADAVHNFTDGMAIAAACQVSSAVGKTMIIAVLFHEIPHEVGDFAVLVSQGFSKGAAFRAQFVSALGALLGCLFGLSISSEQPAMILSFTAGGFIYISLVDIIPDLMSNPDSSFVQTIKELLAICVGIFMMVLIAIYEPHV